MAEFIKSNCRDLEREIKWFTAVLDARLKLYFQQEVAVESIEEIKPPVYKKPFSEYSRFVNENKLSFAERITLILCIIPHIRPQLLDVFFVKNQLYDRVFSEFGGHRDNAHPGFLPTGETLAFILAAGNLEKRFEVLRFFEQGHVFLQKQVLQLIPMSSNAPQLDGLLSISDEFFDRFTTGNVRKPDFGINFPAKLITTNMDWDDLVLNQGTLTQIDEILTWIEHGDTLLYEWEMRKKLRPGFRCLFYGPPGTGKTLTASLMGKTTKRDVYRVDLSMVISKYIGETEKNLSKVFNKAENKDWILFFDEADALFGKRTEVQNSHDRYANQEVSFLLQRVENFKGIVILASNLKDNIDDAFTRRFESIIYFPMPKPPERLQLWLNGFSKKSKVEERIDLEKLASEFSISGGTIMNVVRYASLMAIKRNSKTILLTDIMTGIRKEYSKEGRAL